MKVKITVKQMGKKRNKIDEADFTLRRQPQSVKELIEESVHTCVSLYNQRWDKKDAAMPLSDSEIEDMSEIGKIAFGINYGNKEAEEDLAVQTAIQAYEDGLVRIFLNQEELGDIGQEITVSEGDCLLFIKMTMLSGAMF